jgi:hypothetical protein
MRVRIMGVHIRRSDIKVVGFVSSTTVPWTDVERFDVERSAVIHTSPMLLEDRITVH